MQPSLVLSVTPYSDIIQWQNSEPRDSFGVYVYVYLGWRFGDWGRSSWPESVVGWFFATEQIREREKEGKRQYADILQRK